MCKSRLNKSLNTFVSEFVPLRGVVPLLLECGHVICEKCAKTQLNKPCPLCNMTSHFEDIQNVTLPLNMYVLGLMVVSHNRPVDTDDLDICFSKPINSKLKQQGTQGLYYVGRRRVSDPPSTMK